MTDKIPMKRCGTIEEIGAMVAFIASPEVTTPLTCFFFKPCLHHFIFALVLIGKFHHGFYIRCYRWPCHILTVGTCLIIVLSNVSIVFVVLLNALLEIKSSRGVRNGTRDEMLIGCNVYQSVNGNLTCK
jgi:hypothetical protein